MQWVALIVLLVLMIAGFVAFLVAAFYYQNGLASSIVGGIDLLLGFVFKQVYKDLFGPKA